MRPTRNGVVLALTGELDVAVANGLGACLDRAISQGRIRIVLDLQGLDFCDCVGLAALLRGRRLAAAQGGWVRLARVQPRIKRIIRIAGLGAVFACYPSVDDAFKDAKMPALAVTIVAPRRPTRPRHPGSG